MIREKPRQKKAISRNQPKKRNIQDFGTGKINKTETENQSIKTETENQSNKTEVSATEEETRRKNPGESRCSRINRDYTEKERKAQEGHRSALLYLSSSLQKKRKKNNKEPRTIDNWHHHCLVSFILKQRRQNANKEKQQKERTRAEESHEIAATAFSVSRTRRESKGKRESKA